MKLEIDFEEARILTAAMTREIHWLEAELVHTDKHDLQRALAAELKGVQRLADRMSIEAISPAPTLRLS